MFACSFVGKKQFGAFFINRCILRSNSIRYFVSMSFYFWLVMIFGSFITMISGFSSQSRSAGIVGLILFFGTLFYAFLYYLNLRNRYVSLSGTFGKQTLKFETGIARQLEARLSEMMHQTKTQHLNQATNLSGSPSSYGIPVQSQTAYSGGAQQYGYQSTPDNIVLS